MAQDSSSSSQSSPICFCGEPCSTFKTKDKTTWLKCGKKINYKALATKLKEFNNKSERREFLFEQQPLGCKLNLKQDDYNYLDDRFFQIPPQFFPMCSEHNLYTKIGVSHSKDNNLRNFLTCAAQYPDLPCDYFCWVDNNAFDELFATYESYKHDKKYRRQNNVNNDGSSSQAPPPPPPVKRRCIWQHD